MSSERLYYTDAYLVEFDAVVRDVVQQQRSLEDRRSTARRSIRPPAASLSIPAPSAKPTSLTCSSRKTAPSATLSIASSRRTRGCAGTSTGAGASITCSSTPGQHLLSAAFEREAGAKTVSFHLGTSASTIDLDKELPADQIARVEDAANGILWEDREVCVKFVTANEAAKLPLRKGAGARGRAPHHRDQGLRSLRVWRHARATDRRDRRHRHLRRRALQGRTASRVRVRRPRAADLSAP